jgi:hypothetical protein
MDKQQELLNAVIDAAKYVYDDKNKYVPKPAYNQDDKQTTDKPIIPPNIKTNY